MILSRRSLLAAAFAAGGLRLDTIRFALARDAGTALAAGVRFGLTEAARATSLLGHQLEMTSEAPVVIGADASMAVSGVTFVLRASAAACDDALAQAGASTAHAPAEEHVKAMEWHHSLSRYGASELNDRFRQATGDRMTAEHWLGWMAVKVIAEASMRAGARDAVGTAIGRGRFDGHKGVALRFAPDTRRLIQPLYVVDTAKDVLIWPR